MTAAILVKTYNNDYSQSKPCAIIAFGAMGTDNQLYVCRMNEATGGIVIDGSGFTGPVQYNRNGTNTEVKQDTSTPTSNRPLPVQLMAGDSLANYATDTGATSALTQRIVICTRSETATTPLAVRLSDGSSFYNAGTPSPSTGRTYVTSVRNAYASTSVTTGAWVQLVASLGATVGALTMFDSSGQTLELGVGASSSESRVCIIPPGGIDGQFLLAIASGARVSIRAISGTASSGEIDITFFS